MGTIHVLVTGASGFIGGHVLRLLTAAGNDVVGFDITDLGPVAASVHDEIRLIHGDVTDPVDVYNAIAATNPERIIHLASLLVPDCRANSRRAFEVNIGGTINVLEAAQANEFDRQMNPRVVMQVGGWDSFQAIEPYLNAPTPDNLLWEIVDTVS
ncbi:NAD-dependent epimerase/dehydratase family protein [Halocatena marina]|uniref:NAD-dependent epimerase/dehydratase family protein n=1 Tax=Halocatena marina TaxID=2934937 RepID=UPI003F616751